ncbi:pyridoxamine 5'-phosphate oxidase family protein [Actinocrispum wychmicini]|uniref:Pyridoxamine 5'-phosphate oxidase putative domain-containing protein n=1 Tax=Actinocrispum wychmicini TaxID=1213861 RepID=A0A4R2IVP0_9PSEU|nr:pyridoxamine 5'-phosphate oxidase family protein [Actinocrispum wychmicini]TCO49751.1 hypothetical protein EV192_114121 [Actinocrispum wychmicini]
MGFHEGELAVQRQAGVGDMADRLTGMLAPPDLTGGARLFLAERDLLVLTARDRDGRLWTVPVLGRPGFLAVDAPDVLRVAALPGEPLAALTAGQDVGMIVIDFATRRRIRINGTVDATDHSGLSIVVDQAYGNCPRFIHPRFVHPAPNPVAAVWSDSLEADHVRLIEHADTFFLGTAHPSRGVDSSHRGGEPGFVTVHGGDLVWPDYPGNNMFNSLGNLAVDSGAALLFIDFDTGRTLHLSGNAAIEWNQDRRVRFTPAKVVSGSLSTGWDKEQIAARIVLPGGRERT